MARGAAYKISLFSLGVCRGVIQALHTKLISGECVFRRNLIGPVPYCTSLGLVSLQLKITLRSLWLIGESRIALLRMGIRECLRERRGSAVVRLTTLSAEGDELSGTFRVTCPCTTALDPRFVLGPARSARRRRQGVACKLDALWFSLQRFGRGADALRGDAPITRAR